MITKIVESNLESNDGKKRDFLRQIEELIKLYPDIKTHVVEEIFGGKDKFNSYDVSKHKVNEVARLLGRVKRYVEDNVGYDTTQFKNGNLKEDLDSEWKELETKKITDSDGFLTDYTLYTNGVTYICMYGDKDMYLPDIDESDYESDSEDEAREWFDNYNGFDEDYVDEGVNMVNKINENQLTEGYYDISVDDIRGIISRLEDLVSGLEGLGMSSIKPTSSTYGMSNFVGIASKGYIDLDRLDEYVGDFDEEEESLHEDVNSGEDYEIVQITADVAVRKSDVKKVLAGAASATDGYVYKAIAGAVESLGMEMAGDYLDIESGNTEMYKDNGYEFFD